MTSKYTNKNGVKLLAAVMVFAVAISGVIIAIDDGSDAATVGILDINGSVTGYDSSKEANGFDGSSLSITNAGLGNTIFVSYNETLKQYTITGTLNKQSITYSDSTWSGFQNDSTKGFYSMFVKYSSSSQYYGLALRFTESVSETVNGNVVKDDNGDVVKSDSWLLYPTSSSKANVRTFTTESGDAYKVDFTTVTLADNTSAATGFVANAYATSSSVASVSKDAGESFYFNTLTEAGKYINSADGTYKMLILKNTTVDSRIDFTKTSSKTIIIDLNGKTVESTQTATVQTKADTGTGYVFTAGATTLTISNGALSNNYINNGGRATGIVSVNVGGNLTLQNVTIDAKQYGVCVWGSSTNKNNVINNDTVSTASITRCTINSIMPSISTNGTYGHESISISDSTLNSDGTGIYIPSNAKVVIDKTTVNGTSGIDMRAGNLTITNSTINYSGPASDKEKGDGPTDFGTGLSIIDANDYSTAGMVVAVSNTTFNGSDKTLADVVIGIERDNSKNLSANEILSMEVTTLSPKDVTINGIEFTVNTGKKITSTYINDGSIIVGKNISVTVKEDITIPSGKKITFAESSSLTIENDKTLTMAEGSTMTAPAGFSYTGTVKYGESDVSKSTNPVADLKDPSKDAILVDSYDGSTPVTVPTGKTMIVSGTASGAITVEGTLVASSANALIITNTTGTSVNKATITSTTPITITLGSIKIDGEDYAGVTINDAEGDVRVGGSMAANGTFTINVKTGATANIYFENGFKLAAGATFTINGTGATANVLIADDVVIDTLGGTIELKNATMNIMGQVIGSTGKIDADSTSKVYVDSGAIVAPELTGEGEFYTEDAMREFHISQDIVSPVNTTEQQRVIIDKSITIYAGASLNIRGELVVAEGMKITVKENGLLSINGVNSIANIAGTIVIEGTDGFYFNGKELNVTGTLDVKSGSATIYNGQTAIDGTVRIQKNASAAFGSGIVVNETGTLEIQGTITGDVAKNYGKVLVNGTASSFTVANQVGGTVDIQSVKGTVTVTDDGMFIRTGVVISDANDNTVTVKDLKGVIITSDYTTKVNDRGEKEYINQMFISGAASAFKQDGYGSEPLITINEGKVTVADSLDLGTIKMNVIGKLDVIGTITVAESNDASGDIYGAGEIKVSGLIQSAVEIDGSGATDASNISAVKYSVRVDTITTYYYTNLKAAIESGEKELTVLGTLYVEEDVTIPAQIEIEATDVNIDEDVTLVIAEGSSFNATRIIVDGTLDVQNNDDLNCSTIISDTSAINEKSSIYTNVYNALLKAESGDVVKITKKDGAAILKKDAEVKEGVTLEVPTGRSLGITEGYALTVNGKLYVNNGTIVAVDSTADDDTLADFYSSVKDTAGKLHAVIKVTGIIESNAEFEYDDYKVAGAYYSVKAKHYITTIEKAAPGILGFNDYEIVINGTNTVGDVSFVGTADKAISVEVKTGGITADTMTVAYGTMTFDAGVKVTGQFGTSAGNVKLVNMKVDAGSTFTVSDATDTVNEAQVFTVSGVIVTNDSKKSTSVVFNGNVLVNNTLNINTDYKYPSTGPVNTIGSVTIAEDAVVTVGKLGTTGSFTLNTALAANVVFLDVYGTLQALNGGSIAAAPGDVLDITVYGKLVEGVKDNDAGTVDGIITARNIFVGIAVDDVLTIGSNATIEGSPAITNILYVADGCTVPSKLIKDKPLITFTVEEKKWFTAYSFGATEVTVNTIPVENVDLITWTDADGKRITSSGPNADENYTITFDGEINAIASIKYDVYNVLVYVCEGIDDVYIDGNLMLYVTIDNSGFAAFGYNVKAGEHTITYTLSNGYSGTATMYLDGEKVSGYKVTTTGDDRDYFITLQGIEKSGYVPESPDTPAPTEPTEDEGLGITEYLLIVLVILAAILVVVVAIRMMRS